jgi:hypothetical protein
MLETLKVQLVRKAQLVQWVLRVQLVQLVQLDRKV